MTQNALFTDQYELVMAQGYWTFGRADQEAVFHLYSRSNPFQGSYIVCCGLELAIEFLKNFRFTASDLAYLSSLQKTDKTPLFSPKFLDYLSTLHLTLDIDAITEGTLVFPNEPFLRVRGPLLQCQLLEPALINFFNFSSLIATKASHLYRAARGKPLVEFGLRRAQGPNGGLTASRAAYIGGCVSTSNVLAGKTFGIPLQGTQSHSWVMSYDEEQTAFKDFSDILANDTVLVVDTYQTLQGVKHAIELGQQMQSHGKQLAGIRLDSGDLTQLSYKARKLLDQAGLHHVKIFASGNLNEKKIKQLHRAPIDAWGVGTQLVTAFDQPALELVYKLSAIYQNGAWQYRMKQSDTPRKSSPPGILQVRRYYYQSRFLKDVLYDSLEGLSTHPKDNAEHNDLLVAILRAGRKIYQPPPLPLVREHCIQQVSDFVQAHKKKYSVVIDSNLKNIMKSLIKKSQSLK